MFSTGGDRPQPGGVSPPVENRYVPLKPAVWTWEVPAYFFAGGTAGAAAVLAGLGRLAGADAALVRDARWIAAAGAAVSPFLLIADLGRPARFLNMLRVFKWQSPMSIGAWSLVAFSVAVFTTIDISLLDLASISPIFAILETIAEIASIVLGLVLATYTGVLIGATVIPGWSRHASALPILFGATALGSAASALELLGHRDAALNAMAIAAATVDTVATLAIGAADRRARVPAHPTFAALAGETLAGPVPLVIRLISRAVTGSPAWGLRLSAASCTIIGAIASRIGWWQIGRAAGRRS